MDDNRTDLERDYDALAARLAEAERDAARLDWLDTQAQPVTDPHDSQQLIAYGWGVYGQRTTVREAIDAARATNSASGLQDVRCFTCENAAPRTPELTCAECGRVITGSTVPGVAP